MRASKRCGLPIPLCATRGCNHTCGRRPRHLNQCMLHEPPPPNELPEKWSDDHKKAKTNHTQERIQTLEKRLHYLETRLAQRPKDDRTN